MRISPSHMGSCPKLIPQIFGEPGKVPPGAVFLVLEKSPAREISSYGKVQLNRTGDIILNGSKINDFTDLAQQCLIN
jgi:hypothetical protein